VHVLVFYPLLDGKCFIIRGCVNIWLYFKVIRRYSKLGNVLCESNDFLSLRRAGLSFGVYRSVLNPDKTCGDYNQEEDRNALVH
jgi:hypothetical protein